VVRDTGLGIASEHLPHVFEPFFSTKPAGVGTGLGLAQVYGIIKQHEGYIDVKSQLGQGTVFTIYLRLLDVPREDITTQDIPMEIDGQGVTVLVVEDDTATREALQALLEANHYNVLTASNGKEALLIYKQHRHEVRMLVSDVVMPEMGGLELYRVLRVKDEDVRMLFITGHPMEEERQGILEKGNIHWLQKPFSVKEFSQAVKELLNV
jgi:two-component system cell cycle sensor histidine kinase/response regulator CckA